MFYYRFLYFGTIFAYYRNENGKICRCNWLAMFSIIAREDAMNKHYEKFKNEIHEIISNVNLPDGKKVVEEGKALADTVKIGRTLFCEKHGVESEYAFKQKMKEEGTIMYQCQIGLDTWEETADALVKLYDTMEAEGYHMHRFGVCLERGMALPPEYRERLPRETGPRLEHEEDWLKLGQTVPMQPHMGDFMIGFPNSVSNTINALKAGVTTIGNLSQFIAFNIPGWTDIAYTTQETVKAIAILAGKRDRGTLLHSYLDDGVASLFNDHASIAGWAIIERYIVEELIGARLGHCFGGVAVTPEVRAAWVFALNDIYEGDCVGTMYYGDTISSNEDLTHNSAVAAQYLLWDIMAQLKCPTGHAMMPVPFSEGIRIPNLDEIIEIQKYARGIEVAARNLLPYTDFTKCYQIKDKIVAGGRKFAKALLAGLDEVGVDIEDPVQMLYVMKMANPRTLEDAFMQGPIDETMPNGRSPVFQTDVFSNTTNITYAISKSMASDDIQNINGERTVILASTDVHEHALFVMNSLFDEYGVKVVYLGPESNTTHIIDAAVSNNADAVAVSTHNGAALEIGELLINEMKERCWKGQVYIGGMLNQCVVGEQMPVDVLDDLREMGFSCNIEFKEMVREIIQSPLEISSNNIL
jgi:methylmalonyl-CoA mutase cobalamin-binding subunit